MKKSTKQWSEIERLELEKVLVIKPLQWGKVCPVCEREIVLLDWFYFNWEITEVINEFKGTVLQAKKLVRVHENCQRKLKGGVSDAKSNRFEKRKNAVSESEIRYKQTDWTARP